MTEYLDRYPTMHEYAEGKRIDPKLTDLISRADAIEAVRKCIVESELLADWNKAMESAQELLSALPSADADGANLINRHDAVTVIREECWKCNNMINDDLFMRIMSLPTSRQTDCTEFIMWLVEVVLDDEDWELNAVAYGEVIARKLKKLGLLEVKDGYYIRHIENNTKESDLAYRPSAEAVQGWIPFTRRPMTEEEQKDYPNCTFMFDCVLPDDGEEILVSNRRFVWTDTFCSDIDGCYLDGGDDIDEDMAWMPLPTPYKGGEDK